MLSLKAIFNFTFCEPLGCECSSALSYPYYPFSLCRFVPLAYAQWLLPVLSQWMTKFLLWSLGGRAQRKIRLTAASVIDFTFAHILGYKAIIKIQTSACVMLVRQGHWGPGEMAQQLRVCWPLSSSVFQFQGLFHSLLASMGAFIHMAYIHTETHLYCIVKVNLYKISTYVGKYWRIKWVWMVV